MTTSNPTDKESVAALDPHDTIVRNIIFEVCHEHETDRLNDHPRYRRKDVIEAGRRIRDHFATLSPAQGDAADKTDFVLPKEAYEKFVAACESPAPANEKLKALFREFSAFLKPVQDDGMRDALVNARAFIEHFASPYYNDVKAPVVADIDAALASHPDRQPGMTDEDLLLIEDLANALDREVDNGIAMVSDWTGGELVRRARARIAAIKRAAAGE